MCVLVPFFVRSTALVAFMLALLSCIDTPLADETADAPNIIVLLSDDQGWGDVGYNGHPVLQTPNLDEMASAGVRFDRFYAAAPVCSPTRASLLTGRHPNRMAAFTWGHPIRPQELTIAEILREHGYATAHFGKWHIGSVLPDSPVNPGTSGFDDWVSAPNFFDFSPLLSDEGEVVETNGEGSEVIVDLAIDYLESRENKDEPFFVAIWFGNPHKPHLAGDDDTLLYSQFPEDVANFYGEVTAMDRAIGTLRAYLKRDALNDNTIVWYLGDNGGLPEKGNNGGRAAKGSIYEGGLRVPSIIEWPAAFPHPHVVNTPASSSDILPTLLDAAGVAYPEARPLDGVSLLETIANDDTGPPRSLSFWKFADVRGIRVSGDRIMSIVKDDNQHEDIDFFRYADAAVLKDEYDEDFRAGHAAILEWPWKLHRIENSAWYNFVWSSEPTIELYNLEEDPLETTDLVANEERIAADLLAALEEWQASVVRSLNGDDY